MTAELRRVALAALIVGIRIGHFARVEGLLIARLARDVYEVDEDADRVYSARELVDRLAPREGP